ncbi:energy-coupling factor transporter transmembrane component T family protein [Olegusella massiliensis]|uniref:energy-coupling factor transporter transmembrane component T family protein n=1 Tax=Olegusella massiliensis TaxID=1776381 RepID=UPI0005578531|nr:energy-coupling factor transporter transmembrane component T [Olegusella massiliensis]
MDLELYGDDSKGVVKFDPRTKMLVFLASCVVGINSYNFAALVVYDTMLCLVFGLAGKPVRALKAFAAFAMAVFLRVCIEAQGTGAGSIVMICEMLISLFLFCFPFFLSIMLLVQTTRISQFLAAFQAMRVPARAVIPVAVLFRFIPTVADEWTGIRKAMAFRGIELTFGNVIRHPGQAIEYMLVPLLMSSVAVMEDLAAAAEARGLDADHIRTSYEDVKMGVADYVVVVAFAAVALFVLVTSIGAVVA